MKSKKKLNVLTPKNIFLLENLGKIDNFLFASFFEKFKQMYRRKFTYFNCFSFWSQLFKRHDLGGPHPEGNEELLNNNLFRLRKRSRGPGGSDDQMGAIFRLRRSNDPMGLGATFRL